MSRPAKRRKLNDIVQTKCPKQHVETCAVGDVAQTYKERRKAVCDSVAEFDLNQKRVRTISSQKKLAPKCRGVVYWMWRDQRVEDNWALLFAQDLALKHHIPLHVCFCLPPKFLDMTIRQYDFMLRGLRQVEQDLMKLNVGFHLLLGEPENVLPEFVTSSGFGGVVADFCPLRIPLKWLATVAEKLPSDVLICQVDAHNIVPCWQASPKLEYAARTIRPKIQKQLPEFLTEFPPVVKHPYSPVSKTVKSVDWEAVTEFTDVDRGLSEVKWAEPGSTAGLVTLESFCKERLKHFGPQRNDPTRNVLSNLSPWFHTGQLSVQRAVLTVQEHSSHKDSVAAFVEESVIRRELADNFCFYNSRYDSLEGAHDWARKTLRDHAKDKREYTYSQEQLEHSRTHDDLWNAAQLQLVQEGKMHGFLRMYWAKKILEWTTTPEEALRHALYLNDRYSLDGTDPNGYVGCMWSICGVHDQGWAERPVFGKIRYMNYKGCQRKFDVGSFVRKYKAKSSTTQDHGLHSYFEKK